MTIFLDITDPEVRLVCDTYWIYQQDVRLGGDVLDLEACPEFSDLFFAGSEFEASAVHPESGEGTRPRRFLATALDINENGKFAIDLFMLPEGMRGAI